MNGADRFIGTALIITILVLSLPFVVLIVVWQFLVGSPKEEAQFAATIRKPAERAPVMLCPSCEEVMRGTVCSKCSTKLVTLAEWADKGDDWS